jgi:hypothetical protein
MGSFAESAAGRRRELALPRDWRGVRVSRMRAENSEGARSRWPIVPKWEDRQAGIIPCSAQFHSKEAT